MKNIPVHERLGCFGYWGFGGGWLREKRRQAGLRPGGGGNGSGEGSEPLHCSEGCPVKDGCWQTHRDRVRKIFPELCELYDRFVEQKEKAGLEPNEIAEAWRQYLEARDLDFILPYEQIAVGNVQDGVRVASGQKPKNRGPWTTPWPLKQ